MWCRPVNILGPRLCGDDQKKCFFAPEFTLDVSSLAFLSGIYFWLLFDNIIISISHLLIHSFTHPRLENLCNLCPCALGNRYPWSLSWAKSNGSVALRWVKFSVSFQPKTLIPQSKNQIFQIFFNSLSQNELRATSDEKRLYFRIKCAATSNYRGSVFLPSGKKQPNTKSLWGITNHNHRESRSAAQTPHQLSLAHD